MLRLGTPLNVQKWRRRSLNHVLFNHIFYHNNSRSSTADCWVDICASVLSSRRFSLSLSLSHTAWKHMGQSTVSGSTFYQLFTFSFLFLHKNKNVLNINLTTPPTVHLDEWTDQEEESLPLFYQRLTQWYKQWFRDEVELNLEPSGGRQGSLHCIKSTPCFGPITALAWDTV